MGEESGVAWVKLYHPRGVDVRLPVKLGAVVSVPEWGGVLESVTNAIDAGFLTEAPGLEAGETKETIGAVVLRMKEDDRGGSTPVVDLYLDGDPAVNRFKILSVYLNRPEDVEAFEAVSGLKLANLQVYVGTGHIERGASKQLDKLVTPAPRPFGVCWKPNPRYDPNEKESKKPKRLFSRWPELPAKRETATPAAQPAPARPTTESVLADITQLARIERKQVAALIGELFGAMRVNAASLDELNGQQLASASVAVRRRIDKHEADKSAPQDGALFGPEGADKQRLDALKR